MLMETEDQTVNRCAVRKRLAVVSPSLPRWYLGKNWASWTQSLDNAYIGNYGECVKACNRAGPFDDAELGVTIVGLVDL